MYLFRLILFFGVLISLVCYLYTLCIYFLNFRGIKVYLTCSVWKLKIALENKDIYPEIKAHFSYCCYEISIPLKFKNIILTAGVYFLSLNS